MTMSLIKSLDVFYLEAITIAPFSKKGYETALKILDMLDKPEYKGKVYKGATKYFKNSEESNESVEGIMEIANKNDRTTILAITYEINADWFKSKYISCPKVLNNGVYGQIEDRHKVIFINDLYRNKIYQDFFIKVGAKYEANE